MRDMRLSRKLRTYGNCYCTDLDGVLLCFDYKTPVAIIEFKHMNSTDVVKMSRRPQVQAQVTLANNSKIPMLFVLYNPDRWIWNVAPMNKFAQRALDSTLPVVMSDAEFYSFQCKIRNRRELEQFSSDKDWCHPELEPYILKEEA